MCKFAKNLLKLVAVLAAIAGVFAVVFHFLQKKEAMIDETIDSLDEFEDEFLEEEVKPEPEMPKSKKLSYYSKEARVKRNYIKIPFHEA